MAKSLKMDKSKQGKGIDPDKWESAPAEAVGQVSNASIASMTGGDAGTFEGIVDYILMEEERGAPSEQEIIASEEAGLMERDYPSEVETRATLEPHAPLGTGTGVDLATPQFSQAGGGLEMAGLQSGDMGLDGLSEGTENGSVSAVGLQQLGFSTADVPGGISGGMEGGRVVDHKSDDAKVFKAIGGPDPAQLSARNAAALGGMQGMVDGLGGQVDAAVGGAVGTLSGAYAGNDSALDSAFGANLSLVQGAFADARATVDFAALDAKARVEGTATEALAKVRTTSAGLLAEGDALISGAASTLISQASATESAALGAVSAAQSQATAIANKWAAEAKKKGDAKAASYRGRGSKGTEGKRDEARGQVAEAYGEGYSEDLPNVGKEAVATLEEEKKNIRSAIRELIRPLIEVELPALQQNLRAEVNRASEEARAGIEQGRDQAMTGIEAYHTEAGEQLAEGETAARTDLVDMYVTSKGDLAAMNSANTQSVVAMGEGLRSHLVEKGVQFRSLLAKNPALPLDALQDEIGNLSAELVLQAGQATAAIDQTATELAAQETAYTMGAVHDMGALGQSAVAGASDIAAQSTTDLDSLATDFESGIDELMSGFDTNIGQLRSMLNQNVSAILNTALGGLGTTLEGVRTGVADFLSGFDADLGEAVNTEMMAAIEGKAEEEAAKIKEPSFWDKVVSVLTVVLVVVAIVAITVLTAGAGAAIMGAIAGAGFSALTAAALTVVAGAALGAVSSALQAIVVQIATKGINPADWDWKAIGIDALVGGIVGGLTAGLGVGLKAIGKWGMEAVNGTRAVSGPTMSRFATISSKLMKDADNLSLVGRIAEQTGGSLIGDAATWAKTGKRPTLLDVGKNIVLKSATNEFAGGMESLLPSTDPEYLKKGFSAYMQFISEEAATGAKTEEILEKVEAPVAELDGLELTTDYKPEWSPTW